MLIPKKGKPNEDPSSYRAVCMLDTVGKILERVLVTRLEKALKNAGGLSPNQYGFCRLKSTIDAQFTAKKSKVIAGCMALRNTA